MAGSFDRYNSFLIVFKSVRLRPLFYRCITLSNCYDFMYVQNLLYELINLLFKLGCENARGKKIAANNLVNILKTQQKYTILNQLLRDRR